MTAMLIGATRPGEVESPHTSVDTSQRATAHSPVDIVEEWGFQSFPASDPPANW